MPSVRVINNSGYTICQTKNESDGVYFSAYFILEFRLFVQMVLYNAQSAAHGPSLWFISAVKRGDARVHIIEEGRAASKSRH